MYPDLTRACTVLKCDEISKRLNYHVFVLFPLQGVITTRTNLDREAPGLVVDADERGVYTLTIEAADHGSPVQQSTATVDIRKLLFYELARYRLGLSSKRVL